MKTTRRSTRQSTGWMRLARWVRGCGLIAIAVCAASVITSFDARAADPASVPMSSGWAFTETDGESLYRAVCQACHMADGRGATGAATYPALASNPRLASGAYLANTVLHGRKNMPAFGRALTDQQVADVARYVRTHMGNDHTTPLTAADVKALR